MIACLDVGYEAAAARAACVVIDDWAAAKPLTELVTEIHDVQDYEPGQFYRRELPCIQAVLGELPRTPSCIVVDGYVWLDSSQRPGLGAHLYDALEQQVPVIGVAKSSFRGSDYAAELCRGRSLRPLYITTAGMPIGQAVANIRAMHGTHRMPTILKLVDQLSRGKFTAKQDRSMEP